MQAGRRSGGEVMTQRNLKRSLTGWCVAGVLITAGGALSAGLCGCVGYSSYPYVEGARLASTDPNLYSSREVMTVAVGWVMTKFPPEGRMPAGVGEQPRALVSLVPGMRKSMYERIVQRVSDNTNMRIAAVTPENESSGLPIYRVGRVWLRHGDAKVDVYRPVLGLTMPDGSSVYQCVTVILDGGFQPWLVKATHTREPGLLPAPELNYLPLTELPERTPGDEPVGNLDPAGAQWKSMQEPEPVLEVPAESVGGWSEPSPPVTQPTPQPAWTPPPQPAVVPADRQPQWTPPPQPTRNDEPQLPPMPANPR
jgi:hypothetical protein